MVQKNQIIPKATTMVAIVVSVTHCYFVVLYSVCNAYLRKLSDKFKCWFFTHFCNIHSALCFHKMLWAREWVSDVCLVEFGAYMPTTFSQRHVWNLWKSRWSICGNGKIRTHTRSFGHTQWKRKKKHQQQQRPIRMQNNFKSNINMRKCNGDFRFDVVLPVLLKSKKKPERKKNALFEFGERIGPHFQ